MRSGPDFTTMVRPLEAGRSPPTTKQPRWSVRVRPLSTPRESRTSTMAAYAAAPVCSSSTTPVNAAPTFRSAVAEREPDAEVSVRTRSSSWCSPPTVSTTTGAVRCVPLVARTRQAVEGSPARV